MFVAYVFAIDQSSSQPLDMALVTTGERNGFPWEYPSRESRLLTEVATSGNVLVNKNSLP